MIVVDASLAAKWLLGENDSQQALRFLEMNRSDLIGPELLLIEVAGALVRRGNADKRLLADASQALAMWLEAWSDQVVRCEPVTPDRVLRASALALRLGHPLKDCIYLALAQELGCELATCDAKFHDRATPAFPNVRLLSSYAL